MTARSPGPATGASARWRRKRRAAPTSLLDTVLAADTERTQLLAEPSTKPTATSSATSMRGWTRSTPIPRRRARRRFWPAWAFPRKTSCGPAAEFSGGWRMRVALAAILFSAPDLLLLDEPTNYLDLEGVMWLENFLQRYRGTVLIVSHDRDLLNTAAEFILHLEHGKLTLYTGNYDTFVRNARREARARCGLRQEAGSCARKHMQAFVDRFRAKASKARQAQSRIKMLAQAGRRSRFRSTSMSRRSAFPRRPRPARR